MNRVMPLLLAVMMTALTAPGCQSPPRATAPTSPAPYPCQRTATPINIDGRLDEADWQRAEVIEQFYVFAPRGAGDLPVTKVRMLWDPTHLYVGFECEDDDIWSYSDKPDAELWFGDVAEFFIKPSVQKLSYAELVVAPNGTLTDAWHESRGGGGFKRYHGWSSNARVATSITGTDGPSSDQDTSYSVEIAIPLASIVKDVNEASLRGWTFGAFRYDYTKSRDEPLLLMSFPESLKRGFHYYEGYRPLHFVND